MIDASCGKYREEAFRVLSQLWSTKFGERLTPKKAREYILVQLMMQSFDIHDGKAEQGTQN